MNPALNQGDTVEFMQVGGLFEDGWCEPIFSCKAKATKSLTSCEFVVWLKPELERQRSMTRVAVNGREAVSCALPYDMPTVLQVACRAAAGDVVSVELACDNLLVNKGSDLRRLSFRLTSVRFS